MISSIHELLQREAQAVLNIPVTDAYEKAVELIVEQVHRKKGKLVTSGMGKAGQIAMNIATTFCSTGIPAVFLHSTAVLSPSRLPFHVMCRFHQAVDSCILSYL